MDKKARRARTTDGARWWRRIDRRGRRGRTRGRKEGGRTLESASGGGDADLDLRTRWRRGVRIGRGWERQRDAREGREIARRASLPARVAAARSGFRGDARAIAAGRVGRRGRAPPRAAPSSTTRRPPSFPRKPASCHPSCRSRSRAQALGGNASASLGLSQRVFGAGARAGAFAWECCCSLGVRTDLSRTFRRESVFACFSRETHVMPLARAHNRPPTARAPLFTRLPLHPRHDHHRLRSRHPQGHGQGQRQGRHHGRQDEHEDHARARIRLDRGGLPQASGLPRLVPREPLRLPREGHHEGQVRGRLRHHRQRRRVVQHPARPPPRGHRRRPLVRRYFPVPLLVSAFHSPLASNVERAPRARPDDPNPGRSPSQPASWSSSRSPPPRSWIP